MKLDEENMRVVRVEEQDKIPKKPFFIRNSINKNDLEDFFFCSLIFILCFFFYLNLKEKSKVENNNNNLNDKNIFKILKEDDINITLLPKENSIVNTNNEGFKVKFKTEIEFLQSCLNNTEIKSFEKSKNPKLSIIIPIHNKEAYINRLLRSIQEQDLKKIEIIFIDDYSKDNGLKLLEEYRKLDKRIKIINNQQFEGTLSSIIKGISEIETDYALLFNPKNMLLSNLKYLYNISVNNSKDINDFSYICGKINDINEEVKLKKRELYQPDIREILFLNSHREATIYNKIIKTSILKKAIESIKKDYLKPLLEYHWNTILFLSIFYRAESYISFPDQYIQFHIDSNNKYSQNINREYNELFESSIYLYQYLFEFNHTSNETFNLHINYANDALQIPLTNCGINKLEVNWELLNKTMEKILSNNNLNEKNKQRIKNLLKDIKKKNNNKKK